MIKHVMALALVAALSACSSDSNDDTGSTGGGTGNVPTIPTPIGPTPTGPIVPSGGLPGVWVGQNDFGESVMVVDANQNVYSLAETVGDDGRDDYESVFGPASGQLEVFDHRQSFDDTTATSFTLSGDSADASEPATVSYNLSVQNEGQQITNAATATTGAFIMQLADLNDVPAVTIADVVGTWTSQTSYECGEVACQLGLVVIIGADGQVSGETDFNAGVYIAPLTGTAAAAAGSSQYLTISFEWNGFSRAGILYRDRSDTTRLVINTIGPDEAGNKSFTSSMIR